MTIVDPNMNFELPVVSGTLGPAWATMLNAAMTVVGSHDHSTGNGVKITPSGLNINTDLPLTSNNLTLVRSVRFSSQSSAIAEVTDLTAVYVLNGNLIYKNDSGDDVQITDGSGLNFASLGTIGGDFGQPGVPAAVTYSDFTKVFSFTQDSGIGAALAGSSVKLSDPSLSAQSITITANSTASAYTIKLADAATVTNQSVVTIDTDGQMAYVTTLTANLTYSGNQTYSGTPTVSGNINRSGTSTGGTYSNVTLSGTTSGTNTWSGIQTFTSAPVFSSTTASQVLAVDGSKSLVSIAVTGTDNIVKSTSPTITTPTIAGSTLSGNINFTDLTASQVLALDGSKNATVIPVTGTDNVVKSTSPTITSPTLAGTVNFSALTANSVLSLDGSKNTVSASTTGSGSVVLATSPTLVTPTLGAATATSVAATTFTAGSLNLTSAGFDGNGQGIVPLGAIIAMTSGITGSMAIPATGVASNGWQRCDGAAIAGSQTLSGTTPNLSSSIYLRGSTTYSGTGGSNTQTLTTTQLPAHTHDTASIPTAAHTHDMAHAHSVGQTFDNAGLCFTQNAPGSFSTSSTTTSNANHTFRSPVVSTGGNTTSGLSGTSFNLIQAALTYEQKYSSGALSAVGVSMVNTGAASATSTLTSTSAGTGAAFNTEPSYINVVYMIRVK